MWPGEARTHLLSRQLEEYPNGFLVLFSVSYSGRLDVDFQMWFGREKDERGSGVDHCCPQVVWFLNTFYLWVRDRLRTSHWTLPHAPSSSPQLDSFPSLFLDPDETFSDPSTSSPSLWKEVRRPPRKQLPCNLWANSLTISLFILPHWLFPPCRFCRTAQFLLPSSHIAPRSDQESDCPQPAWHQWCSTSRPTQLSY